MPDIQRQPRVFISYSHDSEAHRADVLDLAQALRGHAIDARLDQYEESNPPLSWPAWMYDQIEQADFVLLIMTETYARRFLGREEPDRGLGVRWESAIITGDLYYSTRQKVKFIPITLGLADATIIPAPLSLTTRYNVGTRDERNLTALLRHLRNEPAVVPAPLAPFVPAAPPGEGALSDVDEAYQRGAAGDVDEARVRLQEFLNHQDRRVAARAAYSLGRLFAYSDQFTAAVSAYQRALDFGRNSGVAEPAAAELQAVLEAMHAHMGPGSAVAAAFRWIDLVKRGRIKQAWKLTDEPTRLALAQAWILANQTHPLLAGADRELLSIQLAKADPKHRLARDFLTTQLGEFRQTYAGFDADRWGAAERPRRFDLDYELIILMETGGEPTTWQPGVTLPSFPLVLRRVLGQWYVAGFEAAVPMPGWPPTKKDLPLGGVKFPPQTP